jgi:hypothetical protein
MIVNEEQWRMTWAEFFLPQMRRAFGERTALVDLSTDELQAQGARHRRSRSFPTVFREAVRNHAACAEWVSKNPLFKHWQSLRKLPRRPEVKAQKHASASRSAVVDPLLQNKLRLIAAMSQLRTFPYGRFFLSFFTTQASYRSGRAHELLGWQPRVNREKAMAETLAWVAHAYPHNDAEIGFES